MTNLLKEMTHPNVTNVREVNDNVITVGINNVPKSFWEEFKYDAETNFGNNYVMKIMQNHTFSVKYADVIKEMSDEIVNLREEVDFLKGKKEDNIVKRTIPTFGNRGE